MVQPYNSNHIRFNYLIGYKSFLTNELIHRLFIILICICVYLYSIVIQIIFFTI